MPSFIKESKIGRKLEELVADLMCISNDLFSAGKEALDFSFNLQSVLQRERSISWDEAVEMAAKIHDEKMIEFIGLSEQLSFSDVESNALWQDFVERLKLQIAGNMVWSESETQRYQFIYKDNAQRRNTAISVS